MADQLNFLKLKGIRDGKNDWTIGIFGTYFKLFERKIFLIPIFKNNYFTKLYFRLFSGISFKLFQNFFNKKFLISDRSRRSIKETRNKTTAKVQPRDIAHL